MKHGDTVVTGLAAVAATAFLLAVTGAAFGFVTAVGYIVFRWFV